MTLFFLRTLLVYLAGHLYLFFHFRRLFRKTRGFWLALPWFFCMGCFPLVFLALPAGSVWQHGFATAGQVWLPFAFFCLVAFGVRDALRLLFWWRRRAAPTPAALPPGRARLYACLPLLMAVLLYAYGLYEARDLRLTRLEIATQKLPVETPHIRLAFAADQHIGGQTGLGMLRRTVDLILSQHPDCILLGGDQLDDSLQGTDEDRAELARLRAPMGVYAVLGNHDAFGDWRRAAEFLRSSGITVLDGRKVDVGPLRIIGVDDPTVSAFRKNDSDNPMPLLERQEPGRFTILLAHRPYVRKESIGLFDLQLSGHSHGGQIIAFAPLVTQLSGTTTGLSRHSGPAGESVLYVTTGVGFSKLPARVFVPPEVVVIDLVREPGPDKRAMTVSAP